MDIGIRFEIEGNLLKVAAIAMMGDEITTTNNRMILIVANTFDGVQTPNYFNSVVRYNEQAFELTEPGLIQTYFHNFELNSAWSLETLKIVAIVQSLVGNRQIHQAAMRPLTDTTLPIPILGAPQNLEGIYHEPNEAGEHSVDLSWDAPVYDHTYLMLYYIYRNNELLTHVVPSVRTFTDRNLEPETDYTYQIVAYYEIGASAPSNSYDVTTGFVSGFDDPILPIETRLGANYPNPFNPNTTIYFELHQPSSVVLDIFNIRGQMIKTLVDSHFDSGRHDIHWDGLDENGQSVSSGVYFYRLQAENFVDIKKMVLMK